jgi:hypothetical protein
MAMDVGQEPAPVVSSREPEILLEPDDLSPAADETALLAIADAVLE